MKIQHPLQYFATFFSQIGSLSSQFPSQNSFNWWLFFSSMGEFPGHRPTFSCRNCRNPVAFWQDLISKDFWVIINLQIRPTFQSFLANLLCSLVNLCSSRKGNFFLEGEGRLIHFHPFTFLEFKFIFFIFPSNSLGAIFQVEII